MIPSGGLRICRRNLDGSPGIAIGISRSVTGSIAFLPAGPEGLVQLELLLPLADGTLCQDVVTVTIGPGGLSKFVGGALGRRGF